MADIELDLLISGITAGIKAGLSDLFSSKASSAAQPMISNAQLAQAKQVYDMFGDIASSGGAVVTSFAAIGQTTNAASAAITKLNSAFGGEISSKVTSLVKFLDSSKAELDAAGKQGLGDNNYAKLSAQAAVSGMTIEDFTKTIAESNGTLNIFGATQSQVADRLAEFSQEIQQTDIGGKLKLAGWDSTELTKVGAIAAMNTKLNMADAASRTKLATSTADLADQIDKTARITGQSRTALESDLKARLESVDSQLVMQAMSAEQQEAFKSTQASLSSMGTEVQNAALEIAAGERLSEKSRLTLLTMGDSGVEFQNAILARQNAVTDAQKESADRAVTTAQEHIRLYQSSAQYTHLAMSGNTEMSAQMKLVRLQGAAGLNAAEAARVAGLSPQGIGNIIQNQQGGKLPSGEVDPGQQAQRALNAVNEQARVAGAGASLSMKQLNDELGKNQKLIDSFKNGLITMMGGDQNKTPQDYARNNAAVVNKIKSTFTGGSSEPSDNSRPRQSSSYTPIDTTGLKPSTAPAAQLAAENQTQLTTPVSNDTTILSTLQSALDLMSNQLAQMLTYSESISTSSKRAADLAGSASGSRSSYN